MRLCAALEQSGSPALGKDAGKIERELGWSPAETFETGLRKTVQWYLDHADWVAEVTSGAYREWTRLQYEQEKVNKQKAVRKADYPEGLIAPAMCRLRITRRSTITPPASNTRWFDEK